MFHKTVIIPATFFQALHAAESVVQRCSSRHCSVMACQYLLQTKFILLPVNYKKKNQTESRLLHSSLRHNSFRFYNVLQYWNDGTLTPFCNKPSEKNSLNICGSIIVFLIKLFCNINNLNTFGTPRLIPYSHLTLDVLGSLICVYSLHL